MAQVRSITGLLLLTLLAGPVLSQDKLSQVKEIFTKQGCGQKIERCVKPLEKSDYDPDCGEVLSTARCFFKFCPAIKGTDEEKTAADLLVQNAKEEHDCDIKPEDILGKFGHAGLLFRKRGCGQGLRRCTKSLRDIQSSFPICSQLKNVAQCLFNTCPRIRGTEDEAASKELIVEYAIKNHICTRDNVPEFDGAVGRSTFKVLGKFKEAANTFAKYKCQESTATCIQSITENTEPQCSDLKKAGQCLFKSCPAISGKEDEKSTAELLVEFAEENYGCQAKASELLSEGNSAPSDLHRSGITLVALILITSLVNIFFF